MTRFAGSDSAMASLFGGGTGLELDKLANIGTQARAKNEQTAMEADAHVRKKEKEAQGLIDQAEFGGEATRAEGAAAGQQSMMSGLSSGIQGIAGGFASMGGTGGATPSSFSFGDLSSGGAFAPEAFSTKAYNPSFMDGVNYF